jgi:hypothetical protein
MDLRYVVPFDSREQLIIDYLMEKIDALEARLNSIEKEPDQPEDVEYAEYKEPATTQEEAMERMREKISARRKSNP